MNHPCLHSFDGHHPTVASDVFIAQGAQIIGDVTIGAHSSVWFNAVARADVGPIVIGERTNIQDLCVIHVTTGGPFTTIGNDVTIGHSAIIHACTIEDCCLIGMGSVILDGAVIKKGAMIAAHSLVPPDMTVEGGKLWKGRPLSSNRALRDDETQFIKQTARNYYELSVRYRS